MTLLRPWLLPGALIILLLGAAYVWNRDHRQLVAAQRSAEAARLQISGQIVSEQQNAAGLRTAVADLTSKNADLATALAAARAAAPGAQVVHEGTFSTGAVVVVAAPDLRDDPPAPVVGAGATVAGQWVQVAQDREPVAPGADGRAPSGKDGAQHSDEVPQPDPPAQACSLRPGDKASIEVQQVTLRTGTGNFIVVGTAQAYREDGQHVPLFGGPFQAQASEVAGLAPVALPRWGAGLGSVCMVGGCDVGPVLALPPLRVFGLQIEASIGVLTGDHGLGGQGMAIARW